MGSLNKKSLNGSIHRIREFELEKVSLAEEFDILQIVGEGWFGKILLVEHKATDTEMVLKALPKPYTALKDFYREFHYGLHLGVHKNIITVYDVAFETAGFYVFSQEYAPLGDLTSNVCDSGIGELHTKRVAKQLASALEHLHTRDLVHRDIKLDNVLVFKSDFSRIKLCDFGETRRAGSVVVRRNEWLPYAPPEVIHVPTDGNYVAQTSHDVWQYGIVIFVCLTGCLPWQKASSEDPRYCRYLSWQSSAISLTRQPKLFKLISSKAQRLFKKYLEPKPEKRPHGLAEIHRYFDDRWLSKGGLEKYNEVPSEEEGLCPSMYSFHSSAEEKDKLLHSLKQYGLETTVDRVAKKNRIKDWIESSIIEEEDEIEEPANVTDDEAAYENKTGPLCVNGNQPETETNNFNGKAPPIRKHKDRKMSTISLRKEPEVYKPPVDPRIPLEYQKNRMLDKVKSNIESNVNKGFQIMTSLPFQKVKVQDSSSESIQSGSSGNTISHKINTQLPQSEEYKYSNNSDVESKQVKNGSVNVYVAKTPPVNRREFKEDKRFRGYRSAGHKGSANAGKGKYFS